MGTWGPGNLDSDYARDDLSTRTSELVRTLWQRAHTPTSREGDEWDYTTLFVELEILFAFDAAKLLIETRLPAASEVRALAKDFIPAWERYYLEELGSSAEHAAARRAAIETSFEKFAVICQTHGGKEGAVPSTAAPAKPVTKPAAKKPAAKSSPKKKPAAKKPAAKKPRATKRR